MSAVVTQNTPRAYEIQNACTKIFFMSMEVPCWGRLWGVGVVVGVVAVVRRHELH